MDKKSNIDFDLELVPTMDNEAPSPPPPPPLVEAPRCVDDGRQTDDLQPNLEDEESETVASSTVGHSELSTAENDANFAVASSEYSPPFSSRLRNRTYPPAPSLLHYYLPPPPLDESPRHVDDGQTDDLQRNLEVEESETVASSSVGHSEQGTPESEIEDDHSSGTEGDQIRSTNSSSIQQQQVELAMEWMFVIGNFVFEVISIVFDQLSSAHKPLYSLLGMLFSYGAMFICLVELVYKARKEKVNWRWKRVVLPWFYYPNSMLPFGTFKDIIGFTCAFCQCIVTTVNYAYLVQKPIKFSVWPIIFAFGLLCSKVLENAAAEAKEEDHVV